MKQRRQDDPEHKFQIVLLQHIFHGKQRDREGEIIPHCIKGLKIQPQRHEQKKGLSEADALPRKRLQEDCQSRKSEHGKHQLIALSAHDPVQKAHQLVKPPFCHDISAHISLVGSLRVLPVVVSNIKAERRHPEKDTENARSEQPVLKAPPGPAPTVPHRLTSLTWMN